MSGERVKAKKKSVKKTAAASAAALAMERAKSEEFIIGNVRCFAEEQRVPIRPITLLVGENSTGKTTFLGGYRVLSEMLSATKPMPDNYYSTAFNQRPFSMGKYRDIVRRPNVGEFCLGWAGEWPDEFAASAVSEAKFSFGEEEELPFLSKFVFSFRGGEKLEVAHQDKSGQIAFIGPDFRYEMLGLMSQMFFQIPTAFASMLLGLRFLSTFRKWRMAGSEMEKLEEFLRKNLGLVTSAPYMLDDSWDKRVGTLMPRNVASFAPMNYIPQRTYSILDDSESESGHVPASLFRLSVNAPEKWRDLQKRLIAFGKKAEMFSDFKIVNHGLNSGGDFHLEVETRGVRSNIADVGHGVSQMYPLLIPIMRASQRKTPMVFLLQEPEIRLHPQAQATMASFFTKSAKDDGHAFIIETHGDGVIDRVRVCVSHGEIAPEEVVILYFEPDKKTGAVKIHPIHVDKMGNLTDAPPGYRRFFLEETDRMLRPPKK